MCPVFNFSNRDEITFKTNFKISKKKNHLNEASFMRKKRKKIFRDIYLFRYYDVRIFGRPTFLFSTFFRLSVLTTKNISCSLFLILEISPFSILTFYIFFTQSIDCWKRLFRIIIRNNLFHSVFWK